MATKWTIGLERNSRPERDVSCADSMVAQPCRGVWISMDSGVKTNTLVTYIVRMVDHTLVNNHQWPPNNSWTANTCPCPKVAMLLPSPICDPPTPPTPSEWTDIQRIQWGKTRSHCSPFLPPLLRSILRLSQCCLPSSLLKEARSPLDKLA